MMHSKELLLMNYKNQIMIIWYAICLEKFFWLQNTIKYRIDRLSFMIYPEWDFPLVYSLLNLSN